MRGADALPEHMQHQALRTYAFRCPTPTSSCCEHELKACSEERTPGDQPTVMALVPQQVLQEALSMEGHIVRYPGAWSFLHLESPTLEVVASVAFLVCGPGHSADNAVSMRGDLARAKPFSVHVARAWRESTEREVMWDTTRMSAARQKLTSRLASCRRDSHAGSVCAGQQGEVC